MKPKTSGRQIQLFVIEPVYKTQTKTVKNQDGTKDKYEREKFVKESFLRLWFYKTDLSPYGEYTNSKGKIVKTRAAVYDRSSGKFYTVGHSVDEIHRAINENNEVGFKKS